MGEADIARGVWGILRGVHKGTLPSAAHVGVRPLQRLVHVLVRIAVHVGVGVQLNELDLLSWRAGDGDSPLERGSRGARRGGRWRWSWGVPTRGPVDGRK